MLSNVSTIANAYIAQAASRVSDIARWLGHADDAAHFSRVSETILGAMRSRLYNHSAGTFADGLNGATKNDLAPSDHHAIQSIIFPMMAGAVNESEVPGMGAAVVKALHAKRLSGNGPSSCMAEFWMLQGLYRVGWHTAEAADLALEVMVAEGQFSWRNMIAQGGKRRISILPAGLPQLDRSCAQPPARWRPGPRARHRAAGGPGARGRIRGAP